MSNTRELYDQYKISMQKIADVRHANAVLQWDQETYLPPKGAKFRGQQISTLSEIAHHLFSDDKLGTLLHELMGKEDLNPYEKRNVVLTLEDYEKNKKYTSEFVRKLSDQTNKAFHSWIHARKENSFTVFEKDLDLLLQLKRQECEVLGYEKHPYNALLNEYEKGANTDLIDRVFESALPLIKNLLDKIRTVPQVDDSFLQKQYPKQEQWDWGMKLIKELNFDFEAGRQDISEHPFSTSFGPQDVRITTRISEDDFGNMTWSCIHEVGHALYEQGLPAEHYGLPLGEACSYSIHESQSRLWENNVGRSREFWQHYYPILKSHFPEQLKDITEDGFYKGINKVQPSLIRTEADELTYHLHVYIRYLIEKKLIENSLNTADIPAYWDELYKNLLEVVVPDVKRGCIQDVHWSHGSFGYFPTYSLGSFYAAQFFSTARKQIPNLENDINQGVTHKLLTWLRAQIHSKGRYFTSEDLCKEVSGEPLNVNHFSDYVLHKYGTIYNLS